MTDDDLRFGDVSGSENGSGDEDTPKIVDALITVVQVLIVGYVILAIIEILFNVSIPLI